MPRQANERGTRPGASLDASGGDSSPPAACAEHQGQARQCRECEDDPEPEVGGVDLFHIYAHRCPAPRATAIAASDVTTIRRRKSLLFIVFDLQVRS